MSDSIKQPFHFWRFFFSLKGRTSRLPFAAFILPCKIFFLGMPILIRLNANTNGASAVPMQVAVIGAIHLAVLWPMFAVIFKRLHDIGFTGLLGLIGLAPMCLAATISFLQIRAGMAGQDLHLPWAGILTNTLLCAMWACALALALWPGNKGSNKYGSSSRYPDMDKSDVF